jgi:SAM-dependent methyltransferase
MTGTPSAAELFADEKIYAAQQAVYRDSTGPDARDVLWQAIAECAPAAVLEIGPGEGALARRMTSELGARVVGVDVSARMAAICRASGVACAVGALPGLPFPDESFDAVVAAWVLHYLPSAEIGAALAELRRLVRPGGAVLLATNADRHMEELWRRHPTARYRLSFPAERAVDLLAEAGLPAEATPVDGTVLFHDYEQAHAFVARQVRPVEAADRLERFDGSLAVTRRAAVIKALRP